jgi:AbrB family looped-hinge helix DNA binding protein
MADDDALVRISKVSGKKGVVQIPLEIRKKLDLSPGTKLVVIATEDAVVLKKGTALLTKERPPGLMMKIRSVFSRLPIRNIEE